MRWTWRYEINLIRRTIKVWWAYFKRRLEFLWRTKVTKPFFLASMRADKRSWCISGGSHSLTLIREAGSECEAFACASSSTLSIDVCIVPIFILAVMSDIASACDDSETITSAILGWVLTLIDCGEDWCANVEGTASFPFCESSAMVFEWVSIGGSKGG